MDFLEIIETLHGKKVFVTGHTGFKGSWLTLWLRELGAEVAGFALDPLQANDHFNLLGLHEVMRDTRGDIRDAATLHSALNSFEPEVVFHLAAQPLVRRSYSEPKLTFDTNVGGSVNLLEAIRKTPSVRALVYVTSDKCYRNKEWIWGYRESDELGGYDPYSASKAAAELVFSSYLQSFFHSRENFGAASVRAGNVIGGGDWSENRIIPDCIKALSAGQPITLRNPQATRPWQHVLDPLAGYIFLAARLLQEPKRFSCSWNFGPGSDASHPVIKVAEQIVRLWGSGNIEVTPDATAPKEAGLLHLNCDKAHLQLGWHPHWTFERAIAETTAWYKDFFENKPAIEISRRQIQQFLQP
ncbi:MAG: CDP-glucose 4,6-dehydratase [Verrucomicrobia bacterium]|nr:CDP-glucose 4,6-dehydratase [Verrucomicrobiota bacterium]